MKRYLLRTILSALLTALLLMTAAWAYENTPEAPVRAVVLYGEDADPEEMEAALAALEDVTVLWRYDSLFPGAAVEAGPEGLQAIGELEGVAGAEPVRYCAPASLPPTGEAVRTDEGLALMGADKLWEEGFTGDGIVIAVLDSGLNTAHEAFADDSLALSPAISREDAEAFAAGRGAAGQYISARIPFVYDYYSRDADVSTANGHGTHVAALAAGYAADGGGTVRFRGAAPGAQILGMKIFPDDSGGGADDAVILRALEDAWNLGADVINLSVGAGGGFSRDGVLDGAYSRAFALLAEEGVIVCCSAGNEASPAVCKTWTHPLPTGAYTDYGAVTSPASYLGVTALAAAEAEGGRAVMANYSAWGPASGLHLAPAMAAFGGPSVSAGPSGRDGYYSDYGTSMASGCASGLFAVTLQALRQRGVTDRREAAALARALLESTARVLTDENGIPLSPRKQGAGLADLRAALSSRLAILDPLVELGGQAEGRFSMTLTLKNLSGSPATVSLRAQVLTDGYAEYGGVYYSRMAPLDITDRVDVSGPGFVTVPAGGEAEAVLELTVSERLREELAEVYPNGFYVEGYAAAGAESGESVHAAFLGYCGDWESGPVMDAPDFRDVQDALFQLKGDGQVLADGDPLQAPERWLAALRAELGANLAYLPAKGSGDVWFGRLLGSGGHAVGLHDEARFAIPGQNTDAMHSMDRRLGLALYTLRNAAGLAVVISDPDSGEIYRAGAETWLGKSAKDPLTGRINPSAFFFWDGTDARGRVLPGGTWAEVDVYAWLDGTEAQEAFSRRVRSQSPESFRWLLDEAYDGWRALRFSVAIDNEAPAVVSAERDESGTLTVRLRDDRHLSYASIEDGDGRMLTEKAFFPETAGEDGVLRVEAASAEVLYVTAEDYASNMARYALDLSASGEEIAVRRTARGLPQDAGPSAWYWEAVDYAVSKGLMECDRDLYFRPSRSASRSEIVAALYRAAGSPVPAVSAIDLPFTDLDGLTGSLDGLCWAYENGLTAGRGEGVFDGSAGVTRQELAVMLRRYAGTGGGEEAFGDLSVFSDAGNVSSWAKEAASWAVGRGFLRGSEGKLNPRANVTRAETAQILMRFLEG